MAAGSFLGPVIMIASKRPGIDSRPSKIGASRRRPQGCEQIFRRRYFRTEPRGTQRGASRRSIFNSRPEKSNHISAAMDCPAAAQLVLEGKIQRCIYDDATGHIEIIGGGAGHQTAIPKSNITGPIKKAGLPRRQSGTGLLSRSDRSGGADCHGIA